MKKRPKCKGLAVAIKTQSLSRWIKVFLSMDSDLRHNKCFFREKKHNIPGRKYSVSKVMMTNQTYKLFKG